MSYLPPPPEPRWDGQHWLMWNGRAWEIMPDQPPAPAEPAGGATTARPGGFAAWFGSLTDASKIVFVGLVALLLILLGGGAFALTRGDSGPPNNTVATPVQSSSASPSQNGIQTVPVSSASNPFTPPVAQDAPDVPPVETSQPTEVSADSVGLYGGSKQINVCDKSKLITFLEQNPAMGQGWAETIGINYSDIRSYINSTTSAILRSDTFVTNHGWENGQVTSFRSILQAGTAVLLNQYGEPVTRCYCGNPLTAPPTSGYEPNYYGPTWKWWKPTSITVIKQSITIINKYTFVNIYNPSQTYTVPAGSNDPIPPDATTTAPTPKPTSTAPAPYQTSTAPRPQPPKTQTPKYTAQQAINYWHQARSRCNNGVFTFEDFGNNYKEYASPTGTDGVYIYTIQGYPPSGHTETFTWLVNLTNGALIPQNSLAKQGAQECGELYIGAN